MEIDKDETSKAEVKQQWNLVQVWSIRKYPRTGQRCLASESPTVSSDHHGHGVILTITASESSQNEALQPVLVSSTSRHSMHCMILVRLELQ